MSSRPPLGAAKVNRRRRGDKRHRHTKPCLLKSGGRRNLPLPYDLLEVMELPLPFTTSRNGRNGRASRGRNCSALQKTGVNERPLQWRHLSGYPNDAWASRVLIEFSSMTNRRMKGEGVDESSKSIAGRWLTLMLIRLSPRDDLAKNTGRNAILPSQKEVYAVFVSDLFSFYLVLVFYLASKQPSV